ncbi:MAG: hypothetical protein Q8840_01565, partial [Sweet potato little leaf phytoplasma]|nr:hypothetical protein [Sweet potato little leaf phytoplasma]
LAASHTLFDRCSVFCLSVAVKFMIIKDIIIKFRNFNISLLYNFKKEIMKQNNNENLFHHYLLIIG